MDDGGARDRPGIWQIQCDCLAPGLCRWDCSFGFAGSRLVLIFDRFDAFFARLEQGYGRLLHWLIDRRRLILMGLGAGIVTTAIAFNALPAFALRG